VFSLPVWLNFMARSAVLMTQTLKLDPDDYTTWSQYDDQDLESYCYKYFGKQVTDVVIEPLFESLFFQPIRDISKALGLMIIDSFFFRKTKVTTALVDGIAILPQKLGSLLDVRNNTTVLSVKTGSAKVELETDQGTFKADRVVLAAPATIARNLYHPQDDTEGQLLATPYSTTVVVYFALNEGYPLDPKIQQDYGICISKQDRQHIASFTVEASKERTRAVGGSLYANFLGSQTGIKMYDWEDERIVKEILADFEKYLPGAGKHLRFSKLYRWKDALAYAPIGRSKAVTHYRKNLDPKTQVYMAGDYMGLACTEGAAETGRWAANELIKNIK
jgi:oxygen-dependent protoporphyrinogen oxidase